MKNALFLKQYFWVLNIGMISLFAFIGSDILLTYVKSYLDVPIELTRKLDEPGKVVRKKRGLPYYSVIQKRNIFNSSPMKHIDTTTDIDALFAMDNMVIPTELNVRLLGTIIWNIEKTRAIIENLRTRKQDVYKVGDKIENAEIIDITRNKVLLMNQGNIETLLAFDSAKKDNRKASFKPSRFGNTKQPIKNIGRNRYVVPRDEVNNVMNNMGSLVSQARLRPHFENGKPAGFRIDKIKHNSLVSQIGVKNGDIIQSVNGIDINSPEKAFTMYNQLKTESNIRLKVKRNRRVEEFFYNIK